MIKTYFKQMKEYIKLPKTSVMSDSIMQLQKFDDAEWKNYIFFHLLQYYKTVDNKEILALIKNELSKPISKIETKLKKHIRNWLVRENVDFKEQGFIINLEPSAECNKEGLLDLKFQHSYWQDKYFSFEAKNLGEIKGRKQSTLINEYVYVKTKHKEDGGMYRYMTNKYACELNFGGMIGFVVGENKMPIKKLTNKIKTVFNNSKVGQLSGEKIIYNSIENNKNTFETIHNRKNLFSNNIEKFYLYHIIFDFINEK